MSEKIVGKPTIIKGTQTEGVEEKEGDLVDSLSDSVKIALDELEQKRISLGHVALSTLALSQENLDKILADEVLVHPGRLDFPDDPVKALRERMFPPDFLSLLTARWPNHSFEVQYVLGEGRYCPPGERCGYRQSLYVEPIHLRVVVREEEGEGRVRALFNSYAPAPPSSETLDKMFEGNWFFPGGKYCEVSYSKDGKVGQILQAPFYYNEIYDNPDAPRELSSESRPQIVRVVRGKVLGRPAIMCDCRGLSFQGRVEDFFTALANAKKRKKLFKEALPLGFSEIFVAYPDNDNLKLRVRDDGMIDVLQALELPYWDLVDQEGNLLKGVDKEWLDYQDDTLRNLGIDPDALQTVYDRRGIYYRLIPFIQS